MPCSLRACSAHCYRGSRSAFPFATKSRQLLYSCSCDRVPIVVERVRREKALDFSGCNFHPGTGSLHPEAIETIIVEATKLSELSMERVARRFREHAGRNESERCHFEEGNWHGVFDCTSDGTLVYQAAVGLQGSQLVWYDRDGHVTEKLGETDKYRGLRLSPDGRKLVV